MDGTWLHVGDMAREQVGQADTRGTIACREGGGRERGSGGTQPGWLLLHSMKHSPSPYSVSDAMCNVAQEINSEQWPKAACMKGF